MVSGVGDGEDSGVGQGDGIRLGSCVGGRLEMVLELVSGLASNQVLELMFGLLLGRQRQNRCSIRCQPQHRCWNWQSDREELAEY